MLIPSPESLKIIYDREYNELFLMRADVSCRIDDETGIDKTAAASNFFAALNVNAAKNESYIKLADEKTKRLYAEIQAKKEELLSKFDIVGDDMDAAQKRHYATLSRIVFFGGEAKDRINARAELDRLGIEPDTAILDIVNLDAAQTLIASPSNDYGITRPDHKTIADGIRKFGFDLDDNFELLGKRAVGVKSLEADFKEFQFKGTLKRMSAYPGDLNHLTPEQISHNEQFNYAIGSVSRIFAPLTVDAPKGVNMFDLITVNGVPFAEYCAPYVKGKSLGEKSDIMKCMLANELFVGQKRIEAFTMDGKGNVSEPMRVKATGLPQPPVQLTRWQSF